jgi:hypothetical protein
VIAREPRQGSRPAANFLLWGFGGILQRVALTLTRPRHAYTIGRVDFSAEPPVCIMRYGSITLKSAVRKSGARTKEALIEAMGRALAAVSARDVRGFFVNCGYRAPAQHL